jgi:hypothetical protein
MKTPSEWQIGTMVADDETRREYINHLVAPRFTARIVKIDPFEKKPVDAEGDVDMSSGFVFEIGGFGIGRGNVLCEIEWPDGIPDAADTDFVTLWLGKAVKAWERLQGHFLRWKTLPPVQDMAERIGLDISLCRSWSDYTQAFCNENDRSDGDLVKEVRKMADVVSTGEVPVLLGMLHAADYSRVADEIGGEDVWRRFDRTHGQCAEAAALAIMRV